MQKYQFLRPLTEDEYEELKSSIRKTGVLIPIEFDEEGNILDGHHRVKAWEELVGEGIPLPDYPRVVRVGLSEEQKIEHILALNLDRRHMTVEQRQELVTKLRLEGWSTRRIAEAVGISQPAVWKNLRSGDNQLSPATITGRDGKEYPSVRSLEYHDRERKEPQLRGQFDGLEIRKGDFVHVLADIPDHSVDTILTDPPYGKEYLPLWDDLGKFAARVLRPDGVLIAYSGQLYLPWIMLRLSLYLQWWWLCGVTHKGKGNLTPLSQPVRKVINQFKPLLIFIPYRGAGVQGVFRDLIEGAGSEKALHNWQQPSAEAKEILTIFGRPGGLVVDPFAGSGSFGKAAVELGMKFIGAEVLADEAVHEEPEGV